MRLWYRETPVGRLADVFQSDGTWYATVTVSVADERLAGFIAFCMDWNERQKRDDPPDADEFDRYADLIEGGWYVTLDDGQRMDIDEAPVFFTGGEVTWLAR